MPPASQHARLSMQPLIRWQMRQQQISDHLYTEGSLCNEDATSRPEKLLQQQCIIPVGQARSPWAAQLPGPPGCWTGSLISGQMRLASILRLESASGQSWGPPLHSAPGFPRIHMDTFELPGHRLSDFQLNL